MFYFTKYSLEAPMKVLHYSSDNPFPQALAFTVEEQTKLSRSKSYTKLYTILDFEKPHSFVVCNPLCTAIHLTRHFKANHKCSETNQGDSILFFAICYANYSAPHCLLGGIKETLWKKSNHIKLSVAISF